MPRPCNPHRPLPDPTSNLVLILLIVCLALVVATGWTAWALGWEAGQATACAMEHVR